MSAPYPSTPPAAPRPEPPAAAPASAIRPGAANAPMAHARAQLRPAGPQLLKVAKVVLVAAAALQAGCSTPGLRAADGSDAALKPAAAAVLAGVPAQWSGQTADGAAPAASASASASASDPMASAAAPDRQLARWWLHFGDSQLATLVEQALAAHTSVQQALATLQQARAERDVAAAALAPTLSLGAGAQRSYSGSRWSTSDSFSSGLDAAWELDLWGGQRAAVRAAEADTEAAAAALGDAQISVAAEVALNYITLRSAQVRLRIAERNLDSQRELLQLTRWRVQAGLDSAVDLAQAETSAAQTAATLPALRLAAAQARHALALLTNRPPQALDALLDVALAPGAADAEGLPALPLPMPAPGLALAFPADTLRQRPDVRQAQAQWLAAYAALDQARAARQPSLSLSGSLGLAALTLGRLARADALAASLGAAFSWPLADGGARSATQRSREAALQHAQAGWRAAVLLALQEVEDALAALQHDRARSTGLADAARHAADAAQLARARYQGGLIDFQTVLDTQRTLLSAQDSLASAQAAVATDHVQLYKALGGGWQPEGAATPSAAAPATSTAPAALPDAASPSVSPPAHPAPNAAQAPAAPR